MHLNLSREEAESLADLIRDSLGDLSSEIADTDSPEWRRGLQQRRSRLEGVAQKLGALLGAEAGSSRTGTPSVPE